jgi:hypothetical protein
VANYGDGSVSKITPGGVQSTIASGLSYVNGVAVNSLGNVFVSVGAGSILEYTPGGVQSTFASGLTQPSGMEFDAAGNLYVADNNNIYKYTPGGTRSTVGTGLLEASDVALQPVPEPTAVVLLAIGTIALVVRRR